MKEVKFRAWDKYRKQTIAVLGIFFDTQIVKHEPLRLPENIAPFNNNPGYTSTDLADLVLMQFTGLKDKSSATDVFEDDIIGADGLVKGNKYQNENLLQDKANFLITGFGTKDWFATYKEATARGCRDA
jgi:hypothetical protein